MECLGDAETELDHLDARIFLGISSGVNILIVDLLIAQSTGQALFLLEVSSTPYVTPPLPVWHPGRAKVWHLGSLCASGKVHG